MSLKIVVGGLFGSEAKGAVTAAICRDEITSDRGVTVVRVGGPNAGHSAADQDGRVWALRQVPAGMVVDPDVEGVIASGSEIDPEVLEHEINTLAEGGIFVRDRLVISDAATIIDPEHKAREAALIGAIGSTGKGIGAARAARLMREATTVGQIDLETNLGIRVKPAAELESELNRRVRTSVETVVIEGTQGYGLGLHTQFYPQVTSGDCRAVDVCAQAGINPWGALGQLEIHVVVRPFPIRVAGNSGPLENETTWEDLGLPVELTTVTKKPRRVGHYDAALVDQAIEANSPYVRLAVSMVDQLPGAVANDNNLTEAGDRWVMGLSTRHQVPVGWVGVGPLLDNWFKWS